MNDRLVTIITGASQGIGRVLSVHLAGRGDAVVLASRNLSKLEETAQFVRESGGEALVVRTDVTSESDVLRMVDRTLESFGRVDVLIANSGIGGPSAPLWETDLDEWNETLRVNLTGVYLSAKAVLPKMIEQESGSMVIIGSISGKRPLWGRTPYVASKMALVGLTRTLAVEAGRYGIRVNLVSPGFVEGPRLDWVIETQAAGKGQSIEETRANLARQSPLHRLTDPAEVAQVVAFLASGDASGITGADINVSNGVVMY